MPILIGVLGTIFFLSACQSERAFPNLYLDQRLFKLSRCDKMKIRYFVLQIILQNPSIFLNISVLVPNAPVFKI